jgi:hypothetical protein
MAKKDKVVAAPARACVRRTAATAKGADEAEEVEVPEKGKNRQHRKDKRELALWTP